jgi:hypothetical protein
MNFDNCIFDDMNSDDNYPIIHYKSSSSFLSRLEIKNSTFKNIINNGNSDDLGCVINCRNMSINGSENIFKNITGPNGYVGGIFNIENQDENEFYLEGCYFSDIKCHGNGGAIFTNSDKIFTLKSCIFESCESTNGSGGAIYINDSGIFKFEKCRFIDNHGKEGNDISHYLNYDTLYTNVSNVFDETCSFSLLPRISFNSSSDDDSTFELLQVEDINQLLPGRHTLDFFVFYLIFFFCCFLFFFVIFVLFSSFV